MDMKIIGHRGARGLAPENTIASLKKGLEFHVDELEFDLRVTRDNIVILHHDKFLSDPGGNKLKIANHDYAELLDHKPDLVTFEEVLKTIGHPVPLYIEVKSKTPVKPIVDIVQRNLADGWKAEHFLLGSKSQKTLMELHTALPEIRKIVIEPWSGVRAVHRARQVETKRLSMQQLWLWRGFIAPMAKRGWLLSAYTLNNPAKAKRWATYGLYGVITDYPDSFDK